MEIWYVCMWMIQNIRIECLFTIQNAMFIYLVIKFHWNWNGKIKCFDEKTSQSMEKKNNIEKMSCQNGINIKTNINFSEKKFRSKGTKWKSPIFQRNIRWSDFSKIMIILEKRSFWSQMFPKKSPNVNKALERAELELVTVRKRSGQ